MRHCLKVIKIVRNSQNATKTTHVPIIELSLLEQKKKRLVNVFLIKFQRYRTQLGLFSFWCMKEVCRNARVALF